MPDLLTKVYNTPYLSEEIPKFINQVLILMHDNIDTIVSLYMSFMK
jgi:hypothetical protein